MKRSRNARRGRQRGMFHDACVYIWKICFFKRGKRCRGNCHDIFRYVPSYFWIYVGRFVFPPNYLIPDKCIRRCFFGITPLMGKFCPVSQTKTWGWRRALAQMQQARGEGPKRNGHGFSRQNVQLLSTVILTGRPCVFCAEGAREKKGKGKSKGFVCFLWFAVLGALAKPLTWLLESEWRKFTFQLVAVTLGSAFSIFFFWANYASGRLRQRLRDFLLGSLCQKRLVETEFARIYVPTCCCYNGKREKEKERGREKEREKGKGKGKGKGKEKGKGKGKGKWKGKGKLHNLQRSTIVCQHVTR